MEKQRLQPNTTDPSSGLLALSFVALQEGVHAHVQAQILLALGESRICTFLLVKKITSPPVGLAS